MQLTTTVRWVLVVDDDPMHRFLIKDSVRQVTPEGTEILEAKNGPEALEILQKRGIEGGFLVTDQNMPGAPNGLELLQGHCRRGGRGLLVTSENRPADPFVAWHKKPTTQQGWAALGFVLEGKLMPLVESRALLEIAA